MTIATIQGSPRKNGNTAAVLTAFEEAARAVATIDRINVADKRIEGCRGCDACQGDLCRPGCVRRDDMAEILERITAADLVLYASPVYVWDFPARMKAVVERHYCLVKNAADGRGIHLLEGKPAAFLMTCGGTAEKNADVLGEIFRRQMDYLQFRAVGVYVVPLCTVPGELGSRATDVAQQMANDLLRNQGAQSPG
jgi:multimeric flavodoxin WrbA